MKLCKVGFITLLVSISGVSYADSASFQLLQVKDARVIDGDTLEVLPFNGRSERIRLLGIDAPESKQRFGNASRLSLASCLKKGQIRVQYRQKDKYSRLLGKVWAGDTDCNLYQVKQGMAWHYKYFQNQQPVNDRTFYSNAEKQAKQKKLGLWSDPHPVNPYNYRKSHKGGR